jgi:hypothetical protein
MISNIAFSQIIHAENIGLSDDAMVHNSGQPQSANFATGLTTNTCMRGING